MPRLYIIPTPIGNLEDITLRAIRLLKEVDLVLAEDTRTTKKLFRNYDIKTTLASFHMHNEHKVLTKVIERLKRYGYKIVVTYVSDAVCPTMPEGVLVYELGRYFGELEKTGDLDAG